MATKIYEIPLVGGVDESVDRIFLPHDKLSRLENLRLDRAGRLEVRPGNTALATTTYSANALTAYDLANYSGRLVALGDQTGQGRPTDLFEYVDGVAAWRATAGSDTTPATATRLSRATAVRETGRVPDMAADIRHVSVACGAGYVCAAFSLDNDTTRIHVYDPATDQTIVLGTRTIHTARVVYAGTKFWIIGQSSLDDDVDGYAFDPAADKTIASPAARVNDLAAAATGTGFTIAYATSTNVEAARFDATGAAQATFNVTSAGTSIEAVAVAGSSSRLAFAWLEGADGAYSLITTDADGTNAAGPTSLFGGGAITTWRRLGMALSGSSVLIAGMLNNGSTVDVATQLCSNLSSNTLDTTTVYADAFLQSGPAALGSDFYFGVVDFLAASSGIGSCCNQLVERSTLIPQIMKDATIGGWSSTNGAQNAISGIGVQGSAIYWGSLVKSVAPRQPDEGTGNNNSGTVTEADMADTGRRQMAQLANELHIAGGLPLVYDGRALTEQGFAETPVVSLAASSGGSLTADSFYFVATVWEVVDARGYILRSANSTPVRVDLSGSQRSIVATSSTPHSLRRHPLLQSALGVSVRVGFYRSTANDSVLHLDQYVTVAAGGDFGDPLQATLTQSDDAISDNAVLYTQSQTPLSHVAPPPYRFTWPGRERQLIGGLPATEQWAFSKLLFPSEPVEFAPIGALGFSGRANEAITAVGAFESAGLTFTEREIALIGGRGPERNGAGEFDSAQLIPSPGGCRDWRSLVSTPMGLFFQMAPDILMLLSRDGQVSWIGQPVRDTLAAFPTVVAAVHVRTQNMVAFACNNEAGSAGRILLYDLSAQQWSVDTAEGAVSAMAEYQGRLAFVVGGTVYLQNASIGGGSGALPTCRFDKHFRPFTAMGHGTLVAVGILGTFVGACTLEGFISYDDGKAWNTMGSFELTGSDYSEGDPVAKMFIPRRREVERFALRFDVSNATNTGGLRIHALALETEDQPGLANFPKRDRR